MNPHMIDPVAKLCFGCGKNARAAALVHDCPAFYRRHSDELVIIITPAERLILLAPGRGGLRFERVEMFEVRDAIDEGVRELRESGRSKAPDSGPRHQIELAPSRRGCGASPSAS